MQDNNSISSRVFNTNTTHPLIQSSQEYIYYKKYVSIHSEDRNILKYPNSSEFEIEMPEDMCNVVSLRLTSWSFPSNYNAFSLLNKNISMSFKINNPYNPNGRTPAITNILILKTYEFLLLNKDNYYIVIIEQGFYNPDQMVTELTNKFNNSITTALLNYFNTQYKNQTLTPEERSQYGQALQLLNTSGGYSNFNIVYNNVSQKIWFGNICDEFILTNETQVLKETISSFICQTKGTVDDFSSWGLPGNLGLSRCNTESKNGVSLSNFAEIAFYNDSVVPRFYYGNVNLGDNGFWLLPNPNLTGSIVNWVEADFKINLMGPSHFYL